jgi:hypothetical protein
MNEEQSYNNNNNDDNDDDDDDEDDDDNKHLYILKTKSEHFNNALCTVNYGVYNE